MTFSIMAKCPDTGAVGFAAATSTLNASRMIPTVKGVLPKLDRDGVIISAQAYANPALAYQAFDLLENGVSFNELEKALRESDRLAGHRQVGILKVSGEVHAWTGDDVPRQALHILGDAWLVMGNTMVSRQAVEKMAEAFEQSAGEHLAERMMRALEAARDAGGQYWDGGHFQELSSCMEVYDGRNPFPAVYLHVDFDLRAVDKLRRLLTNIRPFDEAFNLLPKAPQESDELYLDLIRQTIKNQI